MSVESKIGTLFLEITTECNLRCRQCHMWANRDAPEQLSIEEQRDLINQFAQINPSGGVVFTGGEPFSKANRLFSLSKACREKGLLSVVNTNGTFITAEMIPTLLQSGPRLIVFSLDSIDSAVHDYVRGVPGTFEHVVEVIEAIVESRQRSRWDGRVYLSSILFNSNIATCLEYVSFGKALGVDGVTFQMLDRTFSMRSKTDRFFAKHWFEDRTDAKRWLGLLAERYANDPFLLLNNRDLAWMQRYVDSPHVLPQPVCGSHERNLMVDLQGNVQLCAYMKEISGGEVLGNVRTDSLARLWTSKQAAAMREIMEICAKPCGMLNCHRRQVA